MPVFTLVCVPLIALRRRSVRFFLYFRYTCTRLGMADEAGDDPSVEYEIVESGPPSSPAPFSAGDVVGPCSWCLATTSHAFRVRQTISAPQIWRPNICSFVVEEPFDQEEVRVPCVW